MVAKNTLPRWGDTPDNPSESAVRSLVDLYHGPDLDLAQVIDSSLRIAHNSYPVDVHLLARLRGELRGVHTNNRWRDNVW